MSRSDKRSNDDADSASSTESPGEGLVFHWRAKRGHTFALAFFVAVALLVHASGFYLFQVAPPLSGRVAAQPARVTLLDPDDQTTGAILRDIDDRLVFLRPASLGTSSRLRIEDHAVTFAPSFMRHRVPFRRPGAGDPTRPVLAELLPQHGLELPPVAAIDARASQSADDSPPPPPRWQLSGDLESRSFAEGVAGELDKSLPALETGPAVAVQIWADATGRVVNVLPLGGLEQPLLDDIAAVLRSRLRFSALPQYPLQSGEFRLQR